MKKSFILIFSTVMVFVFIFNNVQKVRAQDTSDYEFTLEEITVTAQKREENQQKVPIAMDIIDGENIEEFGKRDLSEILSSIPNVIVQPESNGLKVAIRGIAQDQYQFEGLQTQNPTIAVNTDGVYTNRDTSGQNLFDIERVEVLYGPQSTMYASATPGGIVNIITADPKIDEYEGSGKIEYGNYHLISYQGVINVPLEDSFALRVGYSSSTRDGYLSNGADDEDAKVSRLKALFKPNDRFSILISVENQKEKEQGFSGAYAFVNQDDVADPWQAESLTSLPLSLKERIKYYGLINVNLGFGDLEIIPTTTETDRNSSVSEAGTISSGSETLYGTVTTNNAGDGDENGVEARISSPSDSSIKWIIGYNYYKSKDSNSSETFFDSEMYSWNKRYNYQKSKAVYGNITYPVMESFRTTLGYRYSQDINETSSMESDPPPGKDNPEYYRQKFNHSDYKIGVEYDLAENNMIYADWSTGYRVNGGLEAHPPEELSSYTIGAKNRFWGNKFQVNIAAYYYDYKNKLAGGSVNTIYDANNNGIRDWDDLNGNGVYDPDTESYTENRQMGDENMGVTGDQEVYGLDLQTSTIITNRDKLDLSVSYIHQKWTRLYFDLWDITNSLGISDLDYSGNSGTYAPTWNVQLTFSHDFYLPNNGSLTARLSSKYQSDYKMHFLDTNTTLSEDDGTSVVVIDVSDWSEQEAYMLHDLSMVYAHPDARWTISAYVKNITNYAVKRSVEIGRETASNMMIGPPRTYGAILSVKF